MGSPLLGRKNYRACGKDAIMRKEVGFTLVELLVVGGIIAVLGVGILTTAGYKTHIAKGRDAHRKSDFKKMQNIFEDYYSDYNHYPQSDEVSCGENFSPYIEKIPCDPQPGKDYLYMSCNNGQSYLLFTNLEYENDPSIAEGGCKDGCEVGIIGTYNFGVSSPNISLVDVGSCDPPRSACVDPECGAPEIYCANPTPGTCCPGGAGEEGGPWIITCNGEAKCCPYLGE